jgi:hypothetical protein
VVDIGVLSFNGKWTRLHKQGAIYQHASPERKLKSLLNAIPQPRAWRATAFSPLKNNRQQTFVKSHT